MHTYGKSGGLSGIELVEGVVISAEEWTPQNGLMTPSHKLNRKRLWEKYEDQINTVYTR
jgi:long-chain acyl-CoA synthetase